MAVYSIIKLSKLEGAKRIDAEYYKPEYLEVKEKITKFRKWYFFRDLIEVFNSGKNWPQAENGNIKFLRTQHIRGILIQDEEDLTFCSELPPDKFLLKEGDLLFTRVGGVGDNAIASKEYEGHFYSDNVLRIRIKKLNPFFVSVFLNSYYGKGQLEQVTKGIAQPLISRENFENLIIPDFSQDFQEKIKRLVLVSYNLRHQSIIIYSQAESLFLEELGLKDFKSKYEKTYTANLSDVFSAHRIDAEYFQPAYEEVIKKLRERNIELKTLKEFILSIQKGIEPGSENYRDDGKPFIRVSNLSIHGFIDRDQKYLSEELYQQLRETYEPKQGDLLLTKDATPGIAYVVKEPIEGIIASGILKLQINESKINKEYLALCINSLIGKMQIERDGGGSVILHWKPEQVKKLKIPLLPLETQQKIAELVQKSHEARKKAKELLEVAKKTVEIAIEKDEKEALEFLSQYSI